MFAKEGMTETQSHYTMEVYEEEEQSLSSIYLLVVLQSS